MDGQQLWICRCVLMIMSMRSSTISKCHMINLFSLMIVDPLSCPDRDLAISSTASLSSKGPGEYHLTMGLH